MGEVQVPKKDTCTVGREKSSGNEVLQEVHIFSSVEPLCAQERQLPQGAPLVDCPFED